MKFWNFPGISQVPKILRFKSFDNLWGNLYIPCLLLIIMLRSTCCKRKIWSNIKKFKILSMFVATERGKDVNDQTSTLFSHCTNLIYYPRSLPADLVIFLLNKILTRGLWLSNFWILWLFGGNLVNANWQITR